MRVASCSIAALLLSTAPLCAQAEPDEAAASQERYPVSNAGRWGVVDADGTVIVPLEYDGTKVWGEGLIEVSRDGLSGLFAPDGSEVIPLRYQFLFGNDTLAGGSDDNSWFWAHGGPGRGRWIVGIGGEPLLGPGLNPLTPFDGKDRFVVTDHGRSGILSLDCEWILLPSLASIGTVADNGLARAKNTEGEVGFIDRDGEWVIEPGRFEDVGRFAADGWAPAQSGGLWGFIDATGEWMIAPESDYHFGSFVAFNDAGIAIFGKDGMVGLIDRDGEWVQEPVFSNITEYADGTFIGRREGERIRLSTAGEDLGPDPFDPDNWVRYDESGTGRTLREGQPVIVDRAGKEIVGRGLDDVLPFHNKDWAPARKGGRWGAVDKRGNWVLAPEYDCVGRCATPNIPPPPPPRMITRSRMERLVTYGPDHPRYTDPKSQDWCHAQK